MLHLYDRATMAHALTLDLDPRLRELLTRRIENLDTEYGDLTDFTEFLVVERGDEEADIIRIVGFSPLVEPVDGRRYGEEEWLPGWDWIIKHSGWYELTFSFGSAFAYVLFVEITGDHASPLETLCYQFSGC